jgi:hypothetical protein
MGIDEEITLIKLIRSTSSTHFGRSGLPISSDGMKSTRAKSTAFT